MKIKTSGIHTEHVDVEVCPFKVVEELLREELKTIQFSNNCNENYDIKRFVITNDQGTLRLEEYYILSGLDYGHYDVPDKIVGKVDRTLDMNAKYLEYLNALQVVKSFKRGKKEKQNEN